MGIDQEHEQNKAVTQGMDGATSLVNKDDESRLARWDSYYYLNMEGILGAAYQLYLNSVNNSPLTSFDKCLKRNY